MKIETPPILSGGTEAQLRQVYSYLFRLSEHLNLALAQMDSGGKKVEIQRRAVEDGAADASKSYNELRGLIVNTAEVVRREMDTVEAQLHGEYEAISSQWGSFRETVDSRMTETAHSVVREYDYDAAIETLQGQAAGFERYQVQTEGFIRQGFVEYNEQGLPVLGIAIGQNLTGNTVIIDGQPYERFDSGQSCAFYTAEKVSFRINGQEVAYVSNRKLYIGDMEVTGHVVLNNWMLTTHDGFAIKWVGGDG